ncbi:MAG: futalosine hydrolase [Phycisphaerales bacterium]
MAGLLSDILAARGGGALLVVAAPSEAGAVLKALDADASLRDRFWERLTLADGIDLVITGVGKANAAGATARVLDLARDRVVVSLGVGGALPDSGVRIGQVVLGAKSVFADEGLEAEAGFRTSESMGFPARLGPGGVVGGRMGVAADADLLAALRPIADREAVVATVSTCAGTDARAMAVIARTGAAVEAMEGAAVGVAAANCAAAGGASAPAFVEIRVVSNTTGDRARQRWDLAGALAGVERIGGAL